MSTIKEQIADLTITLNQISEERKNLIKHLLIQEENYDVHFKNYENKVDTLLKEKDEEIDKLLREKCLLEARILGEDAPVLQYKF